jgi:hypothetical protein
MRAVFISYRTVDVERHAGRLFQIRGVQIMGNASALDLPSSGNHSKPRVERLLAVSIATIGLFLLGAHDAVAQEYYRLQVKQGGKFLDAVNCSDNVALHPGSNYANGACQLWRLVHAGGGWSRLQLQHNGKYLDAVNCSDNVALHPGSNYANGACQLWRFVPAGDGWGRLQLKHNGKYLDAVNCSDTVTLHPGSDYANGACQLWRITGAVTARANPPPAPPPAAAPPPAPPLPLTTAESVDVHCDNYARAAVRQFKLTQSRPQCAVRADGRWQANQDAHYRWCLGAPEHARGSENGAREEWLYRCGATYR